MFRCVVLALAIAQQGGKSVSVPKDHSLLKASYGASHAVIIGINSYPNLPASMQLHYALNDADGMKSVLSSYYDFKDINELRDTEATHHAIMQALDNLTDSRKIGRDDRVIIYFSGHGQTVPLPSGEKMGYFIPSDAKLDLSDVSNAAPYNSTCIEMDTVWSKLRSCPAKHVLVIADACFSGLLLSSSKGPLSKHSIQMLLTLPARQALTAGDKSQEAKEKASLGHGVLTAKLLDFLRGHASAGKGAFGATELCGEVKQAVLNETKGRQLPEFGSRGTEGDMVFLLPKRPSPGTAGDVSKGGSDAGATDTAASLLKRAADALKADNYSDAVTFFRESTAETMYQLGFMCERGGKGLVPNLNEAKAWYQRSGEMGNERARAALKRLSGQR